MTGLVYGMQAVCILCKCIVSCAGLVYRTYTVHSIYVVFVLVLTYIYVLSSVGTVHDM
jgi:hypothetical protein